MNDDEERAAFDEEEGWVCVWAGELTPAQLRDYRQEREDDDEWTSGFRQDIGGFYDHDYLSSKASETPMTLRALVDALGFRSEKYPHLARALQAHADQRANCVIILWCARAHDDLASRNFAGGRLAFLGCWEVPEARFL